MEIDPKPGLELHWDPWYCIYIYITLHIEPYTSNLTIYPNKNCRSLTYIQKMVVEPQGYIYIYTTSTLRQQRRRGICVVAKRRTMISCHPRHVWWEGLGSARDDKCGWMWCFWGTWRTDIPKMIASINLWLKISFAILSNVKRKSWSTTVTLPETNS